MRKEKNLIIIITQGICKLKYKLFLKNITKKIFYFLLYLWKIKLIYGFIFTNLLKTNLFLFLKETGHRSNFFTLQNRYLKKKHLKKRITWAKNTLHVIKTHNNYLVLDVWKKKMLVGGYLFLTIF